MANIGGWAEAITHEQYLHLRSTALDYAARYETLGDVEKQILAQVEGIVSAAHSRFHCPGCYDENCPGSLTSILHCCPSCVLDDEIEHQILVEREVHG